MNIYVAEIMFNARGELQRDIVGVYSSLDKAVHELERSKFAFFGKKANPDLVDDKRVIWLGSTLSDSGVRSSIIEIQSDLPAKSVWYDIFKEMGDV